VDDTRRAVEWAKTAPLGVEFVDITLAERHVKAEGVSVGGGPMPYRLDYILETTPDFVTSPLRVASRGDGWRRVLDLRRDASGIWTATTEEEGQPDLQPPGGDLAALAGALDCDLGLSPLTNLMPIRRHGLLSEASPLSF
jgi:hypothetical protein